MNTIPSCSRFIFVSVDLVSREKNCRAERVSQRKTGLLFLPSCSVSLSLTYWFSLQSLPVFYSNCFSWFDSLDILSSPCFTFPFTALCICTFPPLDRLFILTHVQLCVCLLASFSSFSVASLSRWHQRLLYLFTLFIMWWEPAGGPACGH